MPVTSIPCVQPEGGVPGSTTVCPRASCKANFPVDECVEQVLTELT